MQKEPSFHHFHVQHYCPLAQTLEKLGDRWSFLIVRDLKRGPLRFTDLQHFLAGITPKRLTVQLRALEAEGIVEREREEGRREVRYCLTSKGMALAPVIEALINWGLEYSFRVPFPGETVYPEQMMSFLNISLNKRNLRFPHQVKWTLNFEDKSVFTLSFDGERWSVGPTDAPDADVRVETTKETWIAFISSPEEQQPLFLPRMLISGEKSRVDELLAVNWIGKQS